MGFCDSSQSQGNKTQWVDPLGPTSIGPGGGQAYSPSGAPQMRSRLFDYLGSSMPAMNQAGALQAAALQRAAADAGWGKAASNARQNIAGNYLHGGPELDRVMAWNRAQSEADAANESARLRSSYGRNGMAFSTAAQQADQGARAAANAKASQVNAQTYAQNYMAERANQNAGGGMLQAATQAPLSYLGQVSNARVSPLTQAGNLLSGLSSGGQVVTTGTSGSYSPSLGSNISNGVGSL